MVFQKKKKKENLHTGIGAKNDGIFEGLASESAGTIIKCVAVSPRTSSLENA